MSTFTPPREAGYFSRAAAEFRKAWRDDGLSGLTGWCVKFWPFPTAVIALAALAVGWAATPGPAPLTERFKAGLEATGNWSEVRWLQAEPGKDGGNYLALATYGGKYRCKVRSAAGRVSVQFYRPGGVRPNGTEVSRPVAVYDLGDDGVLRAAPSNSESLGSAAQEVLDALRSPAR